MIISNGINNLKKIICIINSLKTVQLLKVNCWANQITSNIMVYILAILISCICYKFILKI